MDRTENVEFRLGGGETFRGGAARAFVLASVAALGGVLFGYDTAAISGAIGFLETRFSLNDVEKGWVVSSLLVGCIVGSSFAGALSERIGRRAVLRLCAVLFAVSGVASAIPRNVTELTLARIACGIAVGAVSGLSPLYIAEVAPPRIRGRLVSLNQVAIIGGMLVVYTVNSLIASEDRSWNVEIGWRWMLGSEAIPAIVFLALLFLVPESPRWLVQRGREAEAEAIFASLVGDSQAHAQIQEIRATIAEERGSIRELLAPGTRVALALAVCLAILQQITGINVILYYAPEIFKIAGSADVQAIGDTVLVGAVNLLFTFVAIALVDRLGRRPLLLATSLGMGISFACLGFAFRGDLPRGWILASTLAYVASFAVAMGPVVWVVLSEIFPARLRGSAMSVATFFLWLACFCVAQTAPTLLSEKKGLGPTYTFWMYGAICGVAFLFVLCFVPETKGRTLEEIGKSWKR